MWIAKRHIHGWLLAKPYIYIYILRFLYNKINLKVILPYITFALVRLAKKKSNLKTTFRPTSDALGIVCSKSVYKIASCYMLKRRVVLGSIGNECVSCYYAN